MSPITTSTEVDRSAEDVFAYATDPARFPEWQKGVIDGHLDSAGTPGVGARCLTTRRIGFANRQVTAELTHIDPPRTWGVRGIDGPMRAKVDLTIAPDRRQPIPAEHHYRLHRPRHRQTARPARRRTGSPQRDARQPGRAQRTPRARQVAAKSATDQLSAARPLPPTRDLTGSARCPQRTPAKKVGPWVTSGSACGIGVRPGPVQDEDA